MNYCGCCILLDMNDNLDLNIWKYRPDDDWELAVVATSCLSTLKQVDEDPIVVYAVKSDNFNFILQDKKYLTEYFVDENGDQCDKVEGSVSSIVHLDGSLLDWPEMIYIKNDKIELDMTFYDP